MVHRAPSKKSDGLALFIKNTPQLRGVFFDFIVSDMLIYFTEIAGKKCFS